MKNLKLNISIIILLTLCLSGCYSNTNSILDNKSQTQLQQRTYQSRLFDTSNKNQTLRTIIATLQDLDFVVNKADENLGTVSATKYSRNIPLKITVTVRSRGKQLVVRANAQYGIRAVDDPKVYQDFFAALSKAMFLEAQEV